MQWESQFSIIYYVIWGRDYSAIDVKQNYSRKKYKNSFNMNITENVTAFILIWQLQQ